MSGEYEYIKPSELTPLPAENIDAADIAPVIFEGQTYRLPPALLKGKDGVTPYIQGGTWWVNGTDTGIKADYATEEAARASAETTRQSNEATRVNNETSRQTAETSRSTAESTRQNNESDRQTSEGERATAETARSNAEASRDDAETLRDLAESDRATAETSRENAESSRSTAETSRASAETTRTSAETTRQNNESDRQTAEGSRSTAETNRANAESSRVSSENTRQANETNRENAESSRATAETSRASAETTRASAETTRQNNESDRQIAISELVAKGDYSGSTQYKKNNTVLYLGSGYMAIQDPPVGTAPTNGTYWKKIAEKGLDGEGAGDMLKSVYDTNDNGKVDTAEQADNATNADKLANVAANLYALKSYVDAAIASLVDSSPATLDTLNELAAALGDDPNFATTVTNLIAQKVSKSGDTMSGALSIPVVGAFLSCLHSGLDSSDAWIEIGNPTFGWDIKYIGSTSSTGGNEIRIESKNTGRYFQMDHDGNLEYFDGAVIRSIWHAGNFNPSSKENTFSKNSAFNKNFGSAAGTVCQGNDSRLSNARDWTASEVSQSEAEAGLGTTPRKWTAERVAQAISALGGGSILDTVMHREGGLVADPSYDISGWGALTRVSKLASSTLFSNEPNAGAYTNFKTSTTSGESAGIYQPNRSLTFNYGVVFAIKFRLSDAAYSYFFAGLTESNGSSYFNSDNQVGINMNYRENMKFQTRSREGFLPVEEELTDTGIGAVNTAYILVCQIVSSTEIKFWLLDKDGTEISSATHTTGLPIAKEASFKVMIKNSDTSDSGFAFYYAKINSKY